MSGYHCLAKLTHKISHNIVSTIGEGNGTPLQYSCLENPMDGGAWWAAVHGSQRVGRNWATSLHFSLSCIGEGNGNPLQCSCLESPRDGGAWWAAVYGVTQSRTLLKQLSSSSFYYVPISASTLYELFHLIIKTTLWLKYYYLHFIY